MDYRSLLFGYTCNTKVERIGCFQDKSRPLDKLLVYRRNTYNYNEQKAALPRLLCDCAVKAELHGYNYIGLQYFAECWVSNKSQPHYNRDGSSRECFNEDYQHCSSEDHECVGAANTNFVYKIIKEEMNEFETDVVSEFTSVPTASSSIQTTKQQAASSTSTNTPSETTSEKTEEPSATQKFDTDKIPSTNEPTTIKPTTTESTTIKSTTTESTTIKPTTTESTTIKPTTKTTEKSTIPLSTNIKTPSSGMKDKLPSTMKPADNIKQSCEDKRDDCANYVSYCIDDFPQVLKQCPKTCLRC